MAITDLTGTKWVFDTTLLPVTTTPVRYGLSGSIEGTSYSFTSSNSGNFWAPLGNFTYGAVLINQLSSNIFHDLIQNSDGSWSIYNNDDEYEVEALGNEVTLSFTGGNDVTNSTLIAWLQANATQVQEDTPTEFDLTTLHLSPGHYSIKAIAKASGFIDSAASTAVSYDVYGKCDTPITTIGSDGYTFAFTAVAHATSYTLYVDSSVAQTGITTPPTSLDLRNLHLAAGAHTIQIKAIGSGYYNDSDLSTSLNYTVYTITATLQNATANPSNVTKIDPGAVATLIYTFDGVSYECPTTGPVVTNATGTWTKNSTTQGTLVLSAASGNVSYTVSGAEVTPQLDQVTNVSVTGTEATFDEVEHAESYEFFVDGNSIGTYTPVSGPYKFSLVGDTNYENATVSINGIAYGGSTKTWDSDEIADGSELEINICDSSSGGTFAAEVYLDDVLVASQYETSVNLTYTFIIHGDVKVELSGHEACIYTNPTITEDVLSISSKGYSVSDKILCVEGNNCGIVDSYGFVTSASARSFQIYGYNPTSSAVTIYAYIYDGNHTLVNTLTYTVPRYSTHAFLQDITSLLHDGYTVSCGSTMSF